MPAPGQPVTDTEDIAAIVEEVRRAVRNVRQAQGYGKVEVTINIRPAGFAGWEVASVVSVKPPREL